MKTKTRIYKLDGVCVHEDQDLNCWMGRVGRSAELSGELHSLICLETLIPCLQGRYAGLEIIGPRADAARIPGIDRLVGDGDVFTLGGHEVSAVMRGS